MRVDFYQLSRDPVERVAAMLARKALAGNARLLVVHRDKAVREAISRELWRAGPEEFLANGEADGPGAADQPILLSAALDPLNGARIVMLADGAWRAEALGSDRALLIFGALDTEAAREVWRALDGEEGLTREIHKQDDAGRWRVGG